MNELHDRVLDLINSFIAAMGEKPTEIYFSAAEAKTIFYNVKIDPAVSRFSDDDGESLESMVEFYMGLKVMGWNAKVMEIK